MGWLIALGVLILLALLPVGISARYDSCGARAYFKLGPIRFRLTLNDKDDDEHEGALKRKKKPAKRSDDEQTEQGGLLEQFRPLLRSVLDFLCELRLRIRVKRLELKVILAGDDPCDLAINYGRAWAALGNLMPQLERFLVIKKRNLEVECDFTSEKTLILARIEIRIPLFRAIVLIAGSGIRMIRAYFNFKNKRKGGAKT